jgi:hypothetical protein
MYRVEPSRLSFAAHRRVACHLAIHVDYGVFRLSLTQQELNVVRIAAARAMGARTVVATASQGNARLLARLGFESIGATVRFSDRPEVEFTAMELVL